jgi:ubiquinone/menaquinone biosynthesis C-methylase UbiE
MTTSRETAKSECVACQAADARQPLTMSKDVLRQKYDELAPTYGRARWFDDYLLGAKRLRRRLMQKASGKVLDVACGSGENFPYFSFSRAGSLTAIDLSPAMLAQARLLAAHLGLEGDFRIMDAEQLEFPDAEFDTVVSALSTCTFSDPLAALREMRRVCRPGGQILLLEHGRSNWAWLGRYQDRTAHQHFTAAAGCRWNQEPLKLAQAAELKVIEAERGPLGIFYAIEATS